MNLGKGCITLGKQQKGMGRGQTEERTGLYLVQGENHQQNQSIFKIVKMLNLFLKKNVPTN